MEYAVFFIAILEKSRFPVYLVNKQKYYGEII